MMLYDDDKFMIKGMYHFSNEDFPSHYKSQPMLDWHNKALGDIS